MRNPHRLRALAPLLCSLAFGEPSAPAPVNPPAPAAEPDSAAKKAQSRYQEMLAKMRECVESIAEAYGNPTFLQVFTNDEARARALKQRLHLEEGKGELQSEIEALTRKREDLVSDIALKERETQTLAKRLARQRAALDALSGAIDDARKATEDSVP